MQEHAGVAADESGAQVFSFLARVRLERTSQKVAGMKKYAVALVAALAVLAPTAPAEAALSKQDKKVRAVVLDAKPIINKYIKKNGTAPSEERGNRLLDKKSPTPKSIDRYYLPVKKKQYCVMAIDNKQFESDTDKIWVWFYDSKRKEAFRASSEKQMEKRPGACLTAMKAAMEEDPVIE